MFYLHIKYMHVLRFRLLQIIAPKPASKASFMVNFVITVPKIDETTTVNARFMYPWYIRILHIDLEYFYENTCLMK